MESFNADIHWLPAHPAHGSMSMWKYWYMLEAVKEGDDAYQPKSIFGDAQNVQLARGSRLARGLTRKVSYPFNIMRSIQGGVVHILDHGWTELVDYLPKGVKTVVTVHDLIPLRYPGDLSTSELDRFKVRVAKLKSVDAIIAVSEYTKNEIMEILGISSERIFVVPNGVNAPKCVIAKERAEGEMLRVGSLGSILKRKNLEILAPALEAYKEGGDHDVKLMRAGKPLGLSLKRELLKVLGEEGLEEWGVVSESELESFYQNIDVMVVPSLYEGFGLPVLEAMARGIPVICADATSLPEVGGEAALYFDAKSPEALAKCLRELDRPSRYKQLQSDGLLRSQQFSWRKTLEGNYAVYDKVNNW